MNPVQPMAAPVMICEANQEESGGRFAKAEGASGSWAEPYFACHLRCKWGFAYPPGILYRVFTGKKEENRIPSSIPYRYVKAYRSVQPYANN
jgi:hypothetical protein